MSFVPIPRCLHGNLWNRCRLCLRQLASAAIALLASCRALTAAPPDAPACSAACPAGDLGECTHAGACSCTIDGATFACSRPPTTFAHDGGVE